MNGLTSEKKQSAEYGSFISQNDTVFLFETWTDKDSDVDFSGYTSHNFYRKFQNRRAKRNSGGVVLYYKNHLKPGIELVRNHYDTVIWVRLDHKFFGFENDVFISGVYIWGEDSPAYKYVNIDFFFSLLENYIFEFENQGFLYIVGDWNSRVGSRNDFIVCDEFNSCIDDDEYTPDPYMPRSTMDHVCNGFGTRMLDLCKSTGLRIVNGRLFNDLHGQFTYVESNSMSVMDYLVSKPD